MTRAELLARISSRELLEWMEYSKIEPFGQETQYYGPAITSQTIYNMNRRKGAKALKVSDFVPTFGEKKQTPQQQAALASFAASVLGGRLEYEEEE